MLDPRERIQSCFATAMKEIAWADVCRLWMDSLDDLHPRPNLLEYGKWASPDYRETVWFTDTWMSEVQQIIWYLY